MISTIQFSESYTESCVSDIDVSELISLTKPYDQITDSGAGKVCSTDISLEVFDRIHTAAESSKVENKPFPGILSVSTAWLIARFIAQYTISPTFVNASFEGGIMIEYHLDDGTYIMLEFCDDGETILLAKKNAYRFVDAFTERSDIQKKVESILNCEPL